MCFRRPRGYLSTTSAPKTAISRVSLRLLVDDQSFGIILCILFWESKSSHWDNALRTVIDIGWIIPLNQLFFWINIIQARGIQKWELPSGYDSQFAMENPPTKMLVYSWENHLFLWVIYTMAMLVITRGYNPLKSHEIPWNPMKSSFSYVSHNQSVGFHGSSSAHWGVHRVRLLRRVRRKCGRKNLTRFVQQ